MRHRKKSEKFSRPRAQRKALIKSLARAVIINERIVTTRPRAKYLRSRVDKLITWAKKDSLFYRRLAYRILESHSLVKRLFEVIGPRFQTICGGYTRVLNVGNRKGDGAQLSLLELTIREKKSKSGRQEKIRAGAKELLAKGKVAPAKDKKPKEGIISGVRKIFKKKKNITE